MSLKSIWHERPLHFYFRSIAKHCLPWTCTREKRIRKYWTEKEIESFRRAYRFEQQRSVIPFWDDSGLSERGLWQDTILLSLSLSLITQSEEILVPFTKISTGSCTFITLSFRSTFKMIPRTFVIGNFFSFYFDSSSRGWNANTAMQTPRASIFSRFFFLEFLFFFLSSRYSILSRNLLYE